MFRLDLDGIVARLRPASIGRPQNAPISRTTYTLRAGGRWPIASCVRSVGDCCAVAATGTQAVGRGDAHVQRQATRPAGKRYPTLGVGTDSGRRHGIHSTFTE